MSALRSAGIRGGSTILIAMIAALAGGCGRKPQAMSMSAAGRWLVGYPGLNTANTVEYMTNRVKFPGTSNRDTVFTGNYPCNETGCTSTTVELTVTPEEKAFQIDWDRAFRNEDNEGAIVAMIENKSGSPYPAFGSNGHDTVYVWVGPINNDGSDRAVGFYKINASNGTSTAAPTAYRKVTYCDIKNAKHRSKSAAHGEDPDKKHCFSVDYTPAAKPPENTTAQKLPLFTNVSYTSAMFRSNGTWISCVYGCCEVGYAQ
jgi:hypothetical protein